MSRTKFIVTFIAILCSLMLSQSPLHAAGQVLPDELTLNVGDVKNVGKDVTLVLKKRSMRSDTYLCGVWSDNGFKKLDFPVTTYRGCVKGDPAMRVNANIGPGELLNVNFSENRHIIARIREMKINVGKGKSTPTMSAGNKIVSLKTIRPRAVPTPGGYMVPPYPMRRTKWSITVTKTYTEKVETEKLVSQAEQRFNAGDFVFARDIGVAWEIDTLVLVDPKSTKAIDWKVVCADDPARRKECMHAYLTGAAGHNHGMGRSLAVNGIHLEAGILLHEAAHLYGNSWHQLDNGDGLFGGGAFFGLNNVQIMVSAHEIHNETNFPGVIYSGALPPHAMNDFGNTTKDTPVAIDVLDNDYDGNGDAISLQAVVPKSRKGGTVALSKDGKKAVYTPPEGFVGLDRFTNTVVDSTGAGNRTGQVKVDVRTDGLATHFAFEKVKKQDITWVTKAVPYDWRAWIYEVKDKRPKAKKVTYHFPNLGPYGGCGNAQWIDYTPVKGIRGNGLLNPVGGDSKAQVELLGTGDPGRWSLSASVWVLYPKAVNRGGVIMCKGGTPNTNQIGMVVGGWAICHWKERKGEGFRFVGNLARVPGRDEFDLQTKGPIRPDKWYHLVMVIDRKTNKLRAWVNNKEVNTSRKTPNIPEGVIEHYSPLQLFNGFSWKRWGAAPMLVDEVKIFTSALTSKQVAELYAEGKDAKVPKLNAATVK